LANVLSNDVLQSVNQVWSFPILKEVRLEVKTLDLIKCSIDVRLLRTCINLLSSLQDGNCRKSGENDADVDVEQRGGVKIFARFPATPRNAPIVTGNVAHELKQF